MKNKLAYLFLICMFAFVSVCPVLAEGTSSGNTITSHNSADCATGTSTSPNPSNSGSSGSGSGSQTGGGSGVGSAPAPQQTTTEIFFNGRFDLFSASIISALQAVGQDRMLFLVAAGLNVRLDDLKVGFASANISLADFIAAHLIADLADADVADIIVRIQQGTAVGAIANIFDIPRKDFLLAVRNFVRVFNLEARGGAATNVNVVTANSIQAIIIDLTNRSRRLLQVVGQSNLDAFLLEALAAETGISIGLLREARAEASTNGISIFTFASSVMAANLLARSAGIVIDITALANAQTPEMLAGMFTSNNVPASLLATRVKLLILDLNRAILFVDPQ